MLRKILIVDDEPANITLLGNLLGDRYEIIVATDGSGAVDIAGKELPDLILLDVMMPGVDGYSVCRSLKQSDKTSHIPVIFITARNEADDIVLGFEAGGVDYITKPFNPSELNARVKTHMELVRAREELQTYAESLEMLSRQLLDKTIQLNESVRTDYLTGLASRMHIMEKINEEVHRAKRSRNVFSLIIADIDHFKMINDTYGHECGDRVLAEVARRMKESIRAQDVPARWGGEEFILLLPETGEDGAATLAEKLRAAVETSAIPHSGKEIAVTMTFGVAAFEPTLEADALVNRADAALYEGKRRGRNRVIRYSSIAAEKE